MSGLPDDRLNPLFLANDVDAIVNATKNPSASTAPPAPSLATWLRSNSSKTSAAPTTKLLLDCSVDRKSLALQITAEITWVRRPRLLHRDARLDGEDLLRNQYLSERTQS